MKKFFLVDGRGARPPFHTPLLALSCSSMAREKRLCWLAAVWKYAWIPDWLFSFFFFALSLAAFLRRLAIKCAYKYTKQAAWRFWWPVLCSRLPLREVLQAPLYPPSLLFFSPFPTRFPCSAPFPFLSLTCCALWWCVQRRSAPLQACLGRSP